MAYTKTTWVDEVLAGAERFDVADNVGTPIHTAVQIALATAVTVAGTPINAANLNKIEQALEDAHADKFVTLPKMDDMAMGVIGRQTNTTGALSRIYTTNNDRVLMRRADEIVFQTIDANNIAADAVTTAKILDANVTEGKIATGAVTSGKLGTGAVIAGKVATGGVSAAAQLADGIVTQAKLDTGASKVTNRQGGSSTVWSTAGSSNYTPTAVRMQCGVKVVQLIASVYQAGDTVTLPVAFSYSPLVFLTCTGSYNYFVNIGVTALSNGSFGIVVNRGDVSATVDYTIHWLAIGPE